jgi:hypothetical protein
MHKLSLGNQFNMRSYLQNYLLNLLKSAAGLDFVSFTCRYGKFTMYCLIGPEENIMQVTFAPEKNAQLQKDLKSLDRNVHIRKQRQKGFPYNSIFADYFAGRLIEFPEEPDSPSGDGFSKKCLAPYWNNTLRPLHYLSGTGRIGWLPRRSQGSRYGLWR